MTSAVGQFTARVCVNFIILLLPIAKERDTMQYYLSYNKSLGQRGRKHQQMLIIIRGQKIQYLILSFDQGGFMGKMVDKTFIPEDPMSCLLPFVNIAHTWYSDIHALPVGSACKNK